MRCFRRSVAHPERVHIDYLPTTQCARACHTTLRLDGPNGRERENRHKVLNLGAEQGRGATTSGTPLPRLAAAGCGGCGLIGLLQCGGRCGCGWGCAWRVRALCSTAPPAAKLRGPSSPPHTRA